jgi:hypothetical protein
MKTMNTTVYLGDVEFVVTADVSGGFDGDYNNPPEPAEVEIETIMIEDYDVTDFLTQSVLDKIKELAYPKFMEDLDDDVVDDMECHADASRRNREEY